MKTQTAPVTLISYLLLFIISSCVQNPTINTATSTTEPNIVEATNSPNLTETPKPTDTLPPTIEPSSTNLPPTPTATETLTPTSAPSPTLQIPGNIPLEDVDILNSYDDFPGKVTSLEVLPNGRMRLNLYFWNKSNEDRYFILKLNGCAYLADIDNGTRYNVLDSSIGTTYVHVQPQVKVEHWIEFEDAVSTGGRNFTVDICSIPTGPAVRFRPFNIYIP